MKITTDTTTESHLARPDKESIKHQVIELVKEILQDQDIDIEPDKSLFLDYGLDSLDLLDLTFNIEEIFSVKIGANELRGRAGNRISKEDMKNIIDEKGNLKKTALEDLKKNIPEIPPDKISYGLRQEDIPKLLNIDVFTRLIFEKMNGQEI